MDRRQFLIAGACALCTGRATAIPPEPLPRSQLTAAEMAVLRRLAPRLHRLRGFIGHAKFNLLGLDRARRLARHYPQIGAFAADELALLARFFEDDPKAWGFHGPRVTERLSAVIDERSVAKVRHSGHYLYRGDSLRLFQQLRGDIGESLRLASGVRNVLKQAQLYADKLLASNGDLAEASRWVAPPGFSYHAAGDFDVGTPALGGDNFTDAFEATAEYRQLRQLGYASLRYPRGNPWGVAYEPWHIQVV